MIVHIYMKFENLCQQVNDRMKLKLVCYVEEIASVHSLLVDLVLEHGAEAIDSICDKVLADIMHGHP